MDESCQLRIADLGMARLLDEGAEDTHSNLTQYVVTRWWRAPEVMIANSYGFEIDVWSAGTICERRGGRGTAIAFCDAVHPLRR